MRWSTVLVLLVAFIIGCGSSPERPPASPGKSHSAARAKRSGKNTAKRQLKKKRKKTASVIPEKCSKKKKRSMCLPPAKWVTRLCDNVYPDVALHMFQPGTPWMRLYMRHNAQPFNASGGMSVLGDKMQRGEEVIALRRRDSNSMQMNDISGYDVLRWNGACATIHDGEFSTSSPDEVLNARVEWRELGLPLRQKLERQPEILETYKARRKACVGRNMGQVSADCEDFDKKLVEEVVRYVRSGADLPKPEKHPPWRGHRSKPGRY